MEPTLQPQPQNLLGGRYEQVIGMNAEGVLLDPFGYSWILFKWNQVEWTPNRRPESP